MNYCRETTEDGRACPPSRALRRGGRATGQPQGVGSEVYLNSTPQGELVLPVPSLSRGACREKLVESVAGLQTSNSTT